MMLGGRNFGNEQSKKREPSERDQGLTRKYKTAWVLSALDHVTLQEEDSHLKARIGLSPCSKSVGVLIMVLSASNTMRNKCFRHPVHGNILK